MIAKLYLCSSASVDPYRNLALEERLFNQVGAEECILYLWQNQHTVVIGRNQNARAQCRTEQLERDGGFLARRLSGGGAVYHDLGNLNFTFLLRQPNFDLCRQLAVIQDALRPFGVKAELTGRNDLLADGRKFSGSAYYQKGDRRYHHGTLLVNADMAALSRYLTPEAAKLQAKGVDSVRSRVVNLQALCPSLTVGGLKAAMADAFGRVYGLSFQGLPEPDDETLRPGRERFASYDWLFGQERAFTTQTPAMRFPWGGAQLALTVNKGLITDAALYTDALETALADAACAALMGCRYAPEAVSAALKAAAAKAPPALGECLSDLTRLWEDGGF